MGSHDSSEIGLVTNALPQEIFSNFDLTTQLYFFHWQYYFHHERMVPFEELTTIDEMVDLFWAQYHAAKLFNKTIYALDRRIFIRMVTEIEYFRYFQPLCFNDFLHKTYIYFQKKQLSLDRNI